ncbi:MAG TPA: protocatechuate 3,4-dioxygenase subunit alpha [Polyangia bacterium]|jgi:protocatechuate 3,4-dioxygenase alpha subunit|nr:protocatechuate 3,4-dioxygenase subunit alpha [Polyangia bacterium]
MSGEVRSAAQTIGPFFEFALPWPDGPHAVAPGTPGAFWIEGRLLDGAGAPIDDGMIETWQLGPPGIRGFARSATDAEGRYAILTVKPVSIAGGGGMVHAPHLAVSVFARGLLKRAATRIYFPDEEAANAADATLMIVGDDAVRATLMAASSERGYRFDIRMQGRGATVFFDV